MLAAVDIALCDPRSFHEITTRSWTSKRSLHAKEEGSPANEEDELGVTPEGAGTVLLWAVFQSEGHQENLQLAKHSTSWGGEGSERAVLHVLLLRQKGTSTCLSSPWFRVFFWNSCCRIRIKFTPLLLCHCAKYWSRWEAGLGDRHHLVSWKEHKEEWGGVESL